MRQRLFLGVEIWEKEKIKIFGHINDEDVNASFNTGQPIVLRHIHQGSFQSRKRYIEKQR